MSTQWTDRQREVIGTRGENLLVSAAAGSGKTAVLVERILSLVLDREHPVDIDRLLVVTFTKAAAGEMRERIQQELASRLEKQPEDDRLQRQMTLLHHGQICTIDSFCSYILRSYFYTIDLDPGFRVADEGELRLLRDDVVKKLLEDGFEKADPSFCHFIDYFATGRSDDHVEDLILQLHDFSHSHPAPEQWLDGCDSIYRIHNPEELTASPVGHALMRLIKDRLEAMMEDCREAKKRILAKDGPDYYAEALAAEETTVERMLAAAGFDEWYEILGEHKSLRLPAPRKNGGDPKLKALAAEKIRAVREGLKALAEDYFSCSPEEMFRRLQTAAPAVHTLVELTKAFGARFRAAKQEKNILDFSDLEHLALSVLTDGEGKPTEIADSFRDYFEEIMIDEYQDSNRLQECILTAISRENNYFMVGDVKQSIYRFRQACPALFTEKMERFVKEPGQNRLISLHRNFRSRPQVLDSVNRVFEQLMGEKTGGIVYDKEAMLYPGADYQQSEADRYKTEVWYLCEEDLPEGRQREDVIRSEAQLVADRILELTDPQKGLRIMDGGESRIARWKDIVILLRSRGQWTETFVDTLMEAGIPACAESVTGFYAAREIQTVQNYLSLIDNERQDIPLGAVLGSPIGNFTSSDLAVIRAAFPEGSFYQAVKDYAIYGAKEDLRLRLQAFYETLDGFREMVPYTQIHTLLWEIYDRTGFYGYVGAMPGGELRQANLDMLVDQAIAFEATSYKGLFHFLRYIEQIQKYEIDIGEASAIRDSLNAVRIMTIHKSKGLEFPIVFVSGLAKQFNDQDERQTAVLHGDYGVGVDAVDLEKRTKSPSLIKNFIKEQNHLENRTEEIRVLYVAMTRAREKLILTAVCKDKDGIDGELPQSMNDQDILKAASMWKWLSQTLDPATFDCRRAEPLERTEETADQRPAAEIPEYPEEETLQDFDRVFAKLSERISYRYPYHRQTHGEKLSVSELKKLSARESADDWESEKLYEEPVPVPLIPKFAAGEGNTGAAERGTAYHKLMERMDFSMEGTKENVRALLNRLVAEGVLLPRAAGTVEIGQIVGFLQSDIGRRMKRAAEKGLLYREKPFVLGVDASEVYGEDGEGLLLIQGIIDAYFEEDGRLVIVDYKTDRVSKKNGREKLLSLYRVQLAYYARALTRITGKKVKEACIYSFALGCQIAAENLQ